MQITRYHVGESMIASIRHFFRFVDLDEEFDKYGFRHKVSLSEPDPTIFSLVDFAKRMVPSSS